MIKDQAVVSGCGRSKKVAQSVPEIIVTLFGFHCDCVFVQL
jgi:hypothetical protein